MSCIYVALRTTSPKREWEPWRWALWSWSASWSAGLHTTFWVCGTGSSRTTWKGKSPTLSPTSCSSLGFSTPAWTPSSTGCSPYASARAWRAAGAELQTCRIRKPARWWLSRWNTTLCRPQEGRLPEKGTVNAPRGVCLWSGAMNTVTAVLRTASVSVCDPFSGFELFT